MRWFNRSSKPYKARVRAAFFDEKGLAERDSFRWDIQEFSPGGQAIEWTSHTPDAVRYLIEVRGN